jgi:hypothetical protein
MILVLRNLGKDIGSRCVECLAGELHSDVFSKRACLFQTLSVLAVDTDGTRATGSGGMMWAPVIFGSALGVLCRVRRWCVLSFA